MHCQLIVGSFQMSCGGEGNEIMINCSLSRKIVWPTSTRSEALKSRIHMSTTKVLATIYLLYILLSGSNNASTKVSSHIRGLSLSIYLITTQKL